MAISTRTYKDLAFSMFANPMNGDIGKSTGATAVKRAIVGILKTNFNERVFKETYDKWYRDASDDELRSHLMHPFGTFSKKQ